MVAHEIEESKGLVYNKSTTTKQRQRAYITVFWRRFRDETVRSGKELWKDLREHQWKRTGKVLGLTAWLAVLITLFVMFLQQQSYSQDFCSPSDQFLSQADGYDYWTFKDTFQITVAFGQLNFGLAKFVDIAFDITAGRGGQAILAFLTYRLFMYYLSWIMTQAPVTFGVYKGIFLSQSISFWGICGLIAEFWRFKTLGSIAAMTWIILSASFVVVFPTLTSAMTGYKPVSEAFIKDSDGNYLAYSGLYRIAYVIQDADRLNFTLGARYNSTYRHFKFDEPLVIPLTQMGSISPYIIKRPQTNYECTGLASGYGSYKKFDCILMQMVSEYVSTYGFYGLNQTSSKFWTQELSPPSLNITAFYVDPLPEPMSSGYEATDGRNATIAFPARYSNINQTLFGRDWVDPRTNSTPFSDIKKAAWTSGSSNTTLILGDSATQGKCQPIVDGKYQWGFSFILTFICFTLLSVWTAGSMWMWLAIKASMQADHDKPIASEYEAIIQLAGAMEREFDKHGDDLHSLSGKEIRNVITKELKGGSIQFETPYQVREVSILKTAWQWIKANKWWLLSGIIALVSTIVPLVYGSPWGVFFSFVLGGIVIAWFIAQHIRSRCLVLFFFLVVGMSVALGVAPHMDPYI